MIKDQNTQKQYTSVYENKKKVKLLFKWLYKNLSENKWQNLKKNYNKIIEESYGNILKKFPFDKEYDTSKIIDEIIQSNLLTPVPDELINKIMENLFKQGRVMKISYLEIIQLISDIEMKKMLTLR